jgi:hypothetical protein
MQKKKRIKTLLFGAYQGKIANCVSGSATTQHIEAPISANNTHPNNQGRFCCQDYFFSPGLQFQTSLSPPAADMPAVGILKVGFNWIIRRRLIR